MSKAKGGLILGIVALVSAILGCVGPFGFTVSMILYWRRFRLQLWDLFFPLWAARS